MTAGCANARATARSYVRHVSNYSGFTRARCGPGIQIGTAYDEAWLGYSCGASTLHFIDSLTERWTTLRGLHFVHGPQVYRAAKVLSSPMAGVLWSEIHTDWVHEGEAAKLKQVRERQRAQQLEKARKRAASAQRRPPEPRVSPSPPSSRP